MSTILRALTAATMLFALTALADEPCKVAFADTWNTGRSVNAEALANSLIKDSKLHVAVRSRAVDMDPFDVEPQANAVTLLKRRGLDVSARRAVQVTVDDVRHADVILTMTAKHKAKPVELYPDAAAKTFTPSECATGNHADVADAWGKPLDVCLEMFNQVDGHIPAAITQAAKKP